ncbi:MAG: cupin domain-containing protein [Acetobacter sp.]
MANTGAATGAATGGTTGGAKGVATATPAPATTSAAAGSSMGAITSGNTGQNTGPNTGGQPGGNAGSHADAGSPPPPPTLWYWHNWTSHDGISHMTRCPLRSFDLKTMSRPAGPQWQDRLPPGPAQVIFTVQPAHWNGLWHPDPVVQWIIPLKGAWYVTAMDGTKVVMGPGEVSLGEDQLSRMDAQKRVGHFAGNVGDGPVELMVIQTRETPTVDQPCRFR